MKKMDEIMELLTEEIEGFNRSIDKLEGLSESLRNLKVNTDTKNIEYLLNAHLDDEKRSLAYYKGIIKRMDGKLEGTQSTTKWLLALFCVAISISFLTIGYFGYHFIQFQDIKKEAFVEGKREGISQIRGYFDNHQIIYKDFQKWARKQDSMPRKK